MSNVAGIRGSLEGYDSKALSHYRKIHLTLNSISEYERRTFC